MTILDPGPVYEADAYATGPQGPPNTLTVGTVTTGAAGTQAAATITGDSPEQTLDLTIPKGDPGGFTASSGAPANLNTLVTAGLYFMDYVAASAAGSNAPVPLEGHVEVVSRLASVVMQRYSVGNVSQQATYTRVSTNNGGTWSSWVAVGSKLVADHAAAADPHTQYARKTPVSNAGARDTDFDLWLEASPQASKTGAVQVAIDIDPTADVMPQVELELWSYSPTMKTSLVASCYAQASGSLNRAHARYESLGRVSSQPLANPSMVTWYRSTDKTKLYLVIGGVADVHSYAQVNLKRITSHYNGDRLTGTPTVSYVTTLPTGTSVQCVLSDGTGTLYGSASPEGSVTAMVGTEFVDVNATNGAVKWIKATGAGNTGWKVAYGDTGVRNLDSLALNGAVPYGTEGFRVRRFNDTVHLALSIGYTDWVTGTDFMTNPAGFRSALSGYMPPPYSTPAGVTITGGTSAAYKLHATGSNTAVRFQWTFTTREAWPTSLPGTAG